MLLSLCCNSSVLLMGGGISKCSKCHKDSTSVFSTDLNDTVSTRPKEIAPFKHLIDLGKKEEIFGAELLEPIEVTGRPRGFRIKEGQRIIAGYDEGAGERMIVCENLNEMHQVYDAYARGEAVQLNWYVGPDPGFITIHGNGEN